MMNKEEDKKVIVSFRISKSTFKLIQKIAKKNRKTVSDIFREIIEHYVRSKNAGIIEKLYISKEVYDALLNNSPVSIEGKRWEDVMNLFEEYVFWTSGFSLRELSIKNAISLLIDYIEELFGNVNATFKEIRTNTFVILLNTQNEKLLELAAHVVKSILEKKLKLSLKSIERMKNRVFIHVAFSD